MKIFKNFVVIATLFVSTFAYATATTKGYMLDAAVTLLDAERAMMIGGRDPDDNKTFTPSAITQIISTDGHWTRGADLNIARTESSAIKLRDGRIFVSGGEASPRKMVLQAEIFNPPTGTWMVTAPSALPHANHRQIELKDGRILVTGGFLNPNGGGVYYPGSQSLNNSEIYDPVLNTWTSIAKDTLDSDVWRATLILLPSGNVLAATNVNDLNSSIYNPNTNQWQDSRLPRGSIRGYSGVAQTPDGNVYMLAASWGQEDQSVKAEVFKYVENTNTWEKINSTDIKNKYHNGFFVPNIGAGIDNNKIFFHSGFYGSGRGVIYNLDSKNWNTVRGFKCGINMWVRDYMVMLDATHLMDIAPPGSGYCVDVLSIGL